MGGYGGLGVMAYHIGDVDVAEVWSKRCRCGYGCIVLYLLSYRLVLIGAFKDYRLVLDVGHRDIADEDVLCLAATCDAALEAQTGIGVAEAVVAYNDVLHAARIL